MSDTKLKLEETFKRLGQVTEAAVMYSVRVVEQHGFALDKFRDNDLETLTRYGDGRFQVGIYDERARVFKLWREFYEMLREQPKNLPFDFEAVIKLMLILGTEILDNPDGVQQVEKYDHVEPRPQDGDVKAAVPTYDVLMLKVVKLMAKAGTRRHGLKAGWTIEEIQYGLKMAMPEVQGQAIAAVLVRLMGEGVVENFGNGNPGIYIYCLVDDYADRMGVDSEQAQEKSGVDEEEELLQGLHGVLKSNTGANGKLVSWKLGSLFYALRDQHPWITKADVTAAASAAQWCEEVTPGVYRWADVESATAQVVESAEPLLVSCGTAQAPRWYREGTPEQRAALQDEPQVLAGVLPELHGPPVGVVEAADAIYGVLKAEAASGQRRIWKEYDILGFLGRGVELGGKFKAEHLSQGMLSAAINFLVVEGRLEVVPPSPERPWIKQPGWKVI